MEIPKYLPSRDLYKAPLQKHYKAIVVGGGHNGLVAAAYMAKSGCVSTYDRCTTFFQAELTSVATFVAHQHSLPH